MSSTEDLTNFLSNEGFEKLIPNFLEAGYTKLEQIEEIIQNSSKEAFDSFKAKCEFLTSIDIIKLSMAIKKSKSPPDRSPNSQHSPRILDRKEYGNMNMNNIYRGKREEVEVEYGEGNRLFLWFSEQRKLHKRIITVKELKSRAKELCGTHPTNQWVINFMRTMKIARKRHSDGVITRYHAPLLPINT